MTVTAQAGGGNRLSVMHENALTLEGTMSGQELDSACVRQMDTLYLARMHQGQARMSNTNAQHVTRSSPSASHRKNMLRVKNSCISAEDGVGAPFLLDLHSSSIST